MAALTLALVLVATPAEAGNTVQRWQPLIDAAAQRYAMPSDWIMRVMQAESGGATMLDGHPIRSAAGAMGLMQIMPGTWNDMRHAYGLGSDPDDPASNIEAGTAYLRLLYDRFGYPGLFAAYNAGPARYADYLAGRSALPGETRGYLARIVGSADRGANRGDDRSIPSLFVVRREITPLLQGDRTGSQSAALFAIAVRP